MGVCRAQQLNAELCVHSDLSVDMSLFLVVIKRLKCEVFMAFKLQKRKLGLQKVIGF